jgi:hypothetical protein
MVFKLEAPCRINIESCSETGVFLPGHIIGQSLSYEYSTILVVFIKIMNTIVRSQLQPIREAVGYGNIIVFLIG